MAGRVHAYRAATGATLLFAFAWCWVCGNRGLFPLDQSIVLDGAWRIASGQVPFVDFSTPHGLSIMALQAGVFHVLGVGYDVHVGLAATLNLIATALAMVLVGRLLPGRRGVQLLAGILTAIWFHPPFGTPYSEQTAFFFSLCGLVAAVEAYGRAGGLRAALLFATGLCACLAFLGKQNAGGLFLPVYAVAVVSIGGRSGFALWRSLAALAAGCLAGAVGFTVWLYAYSSPAGFRDAYFGIPSGLLAARVDTFDLLTQPWLGDGRGPTNFVLMLWLIVAVVSVVRHRALARSNVERDRDVFAAGILAVTLILFQNLFNLTTNNGGENGFAFTGIIVALTLGVAFQPAAPQRSRWAWLGRGTATLLVLVLLVRGIEIGWSRTMHDTMASAAFTEQIDRPRWKSLHWPRELDIGNAVIPAGDVQQLVTWLERDGRDFFVFPDFTWLYAALERSSPQPILWFHQGLTYSADDPTFDDSIVRALDDRGIDVIVLEEQTFTGSLEKRVADFPRLATLIGYGFDETARYGIFIVLERRGGLR